MRFRQVHLDFHTSEMIENIGAEFSKENFQHMLKLGHVDSITVFSKCHHGWAYHPSRANQMHPHLSFDLLGAMIEAAHEIDVKTPVYLSAGLDEKVTREHPEWLLRDQEDKPNTSFLKPGFHLLCLNTPYLEILLAQIQEVVRNYDADGIFLDIVGVRPCYCQHCVRDILARGKDPRDEAAVLEQAEYVYKNYANRVRAAIDEIKPGLPVFHNGGHIPKGRRDLAFLNSHIEMESLPTAPGWGYDHFPLSVRYVQGLGMEYLGMTGKFHKNWGEFGGYKHPNALRYEMALDLANGSKCSIGDQLHPSGKMDEATYALIGTAYREVEEKEPWCDQVTNLADVALLSTEALGIDNSRHSIYDIGAGRLLREGKYLFDVIDMEYDFKAYKVLLLPDVVTVNERLHEKLEDFIHAGGKILATGLSGLKEDLSDFAVDLGIQYAGENPYHPTYFRPGFELKNLKNAAFVLYTQGQVVKPLSAEVIAGQENPYFNRDTFHFCSHAHTPGTNTYACPGMTLGKNGIYIAWNICQEYAEQGSLILKELFFHALDTLLGDSKTLTTNLPAQGLVSVQEQKEQHRYVNHLIYAAPVKRGTDICVIEDILPVYNVEVALRLPRPIKRVYLAPQMQPLAFQTTDTAVTFTLPTLDCHQMVVLDYEV